MTAVAGAWPEEGERRADWARKYPPLLTIAVAMLVAVAILPSRLNLPQSNPTQTVEYAPVPPNDEKRPPPQQGNLSALGLGRTGGIGAGNATAGLGQNGLGGDESIGTAPPNQRRPSPAPRRGRQTVDGAGDQLQDIQPGVNCTGDPPRQTDDPLAPPCVPYYSGQNPGATYGLGVTKDEIRVVIYLEGGVRYTNASDSSNADTPDGALYDLNQPKNSAPICGTTAPSKTEHLTVNGLRVWHDYFSQRFQTYGRKPHFYVYFSQRDHSPEGRRRDAATVLSCVQPFAEVSFADQGNESDFLVAMARKGVLNFGSFALRPAEFFNRFPKMIWSYLPSIEQQATTYGDYLCTKVVGKAPVLANADLQQTSGGKRKLGMISTSDPNWPGLKLMHDLIKKRVTECGGEIVDEGYFPECCFAQDPNENPSYANTQMAQFKLDGITTIIWPGGLDGNYGKASTSIGYYPEWILLGDNYLDVPTAVILMGMSQSLNGRGITVTPQVVEPALEQRQCFRDFRQIDTTTPVSDVSYVCGYYPNLFQLFVGIQVAGPYLNPTSIDQGFHAIPQRPKSDDPRVPACFYQPNDYTCIKDAQAEIWDAAGRTPVAGTGAGGTGGCYRSIQGGKRYLSVGSEPRPWPATNVNDFANGQKATDPTEPCNGFDHAVTFRT